DRYLEATDDEAAAFSELRSLVGRVDPDLAELVDRLAAYHSESHATGVELMAGRLARDRYLYDLMLQQASDVSFAEASDELESALLAEMSERQEAIRRSQLFQTLTTIALTLLALAAALLV